MKINFKIHSVLLLCFFSFSTLIAQGVSLETTRTDEEPQAKEKQIGLFYSKSNGLSLMYKQELKNQLFLRASIKQPWFSSRQSFGIGVNLGLEKHFKVNEKLDFYLGVEAGINFSKHKYTPTDFLNRNIEYNISAVAGLEYKVNKNFLLFAEIRPSYNRSFSLDNNSSRANFNMPLSVGAMLTFGRNKKKKNEKPFRY